MAAGRKGGLAKQSFGNCAYESARQIINTLIKLNIGETDLLDIAIKKDLFYLSPYKESDQIKLESGCRPWSETDECSLDVLADDFGEATDMNVKGILSEFEIESSMIESQDIDSIFAAVADGKGVITTHEAGRLWYDNPMYLGDHAINVTGVEYDADGNPVTVFVNDTGEKGSCGKPIPFKRCKDSLIVDDFRIQSIVTEQKVW